MDPRLTLGLAVVSLLASQAARAEDERRTTWAVLPVRGETPPPRDPTLLRLTRELGEALHATVGEPVRVLSREMRDDACPALDGICPRDVAVLANAERVVSFVLEPDFQSVRVRVYGRLSGFERSGALPCRWAEGFVACDAAAMREVIADPPKAADPGAVARGFAKLKKRLAKCAREGWGAVPAQSTNGAEPVVELRVDARGRAADVRIKPAGIEQAPAFACMARVIEAFRVPAASGPHEGLQRFPLPRP